MAVQTTDVELRFDNVATGVALQCGIKIQSVTSVYVVYGIARIAAAEGDVEIVKSEIDDNLFTVTPQASLLVKINALIASDPNEANRVYVGRRLAYTTDFTETDAFLRQRIADEFDRTIMRFQQLANDVAAADVTQAKEIYDQVQAALVDIDEKLTATEDFMKRAEQAALDAEALAGANATAIVVTPSAEVPQTDVRSALEAIATRTTDLEEADIAQDAVNASTNTRLSKAEHDTQLLMKLRGIQ